MLHLMVGSLFPSKLDTFRQASNLFFQGRLAEAKRVIEAKPLVGIPNNAYELYLLGEIALKERKYKLAEKFVRKAISGASKEAIFYHCLGMSLDYQGRWVESEVELRKAFVLEPDEHPFQMSLGFVLLKTGKTQEAIALLSESFERFEKFERFNGLNLNNLCNNFDYIGVLLEAGQYQKVWEYFERCESQFLSAYRAGISSEASAKSKESFDELWQLVESVVDSVPLWQGQSLTGKNILFYGTTKIILSGLGDDIMMLRFISKVADLGANIILAVAPPLRTLAAQLPVTIWTKKSSTTQFDYRLPLCLLPGRFGITVDSIPTEPYLSPEPALVAQWQERLSKFPGLRVGLVWRSGEDSSRMIEPEDIAQSQLLSVAGVSFFSLQVHKQAPSDIEILRNQGEITDWAPYLTDFRETAAAIAALDLVISIDTSVANLCGALGRKDWVLVSVFDDFRWQHGWFPTMKVFRQTSYGQWDLSEVVEQLANAANNPVLARSYALEEEQARSISSHR